MHRYLPKYIFQCSDEKYPPSLVTAWLEKMEEIAPPPKLILGETDIEGLRLDFNCGLRLQIPEGDKDEYRVIIGNSESGQVYFDKEISGVILVSLEKYYIPWQIDIYRQGVHIFSHVLDLAGQDVFFPFLGEALGDAIALLPYVADFIQRHKCRPRVHIAPYLRDIAVRYYPDLLFFDYIGQSTYATYAVGTWMNFLTGASVDSRLMPMEKIGKTSFGTPYTLRTARFFPTKPRIIKEPYVCIGVQASAPWKGWHYPGGWSDVVDYLKKCGYRVLCIDRERENHWNDLSNIIPDNAEDYTGDIPLIERINLLAYADFFIGLGSGLAWLAYAAKCPVVMIVGFSLPWFEFDTPYRVQNYSRCYGCYNDVRAEFSNVENCPFHHGTDKEFECSRSITPLQVINVIDRLRDDLLIH